VASTSALLRPSSIPQTSILINYCLNISAADMDGEWEVPPVAGNTS